MELHQLRYFCAVAETGSFSRAAEQSHVSQPSLSQQILKLEDELGARLFDRLGRSVRLTELGKTFLPRAHAVLRELEAAKGDVVEGKEFIGGPVSVGVIPTVGPYFLPTRLTAFSRKFGQVRLTVVEEITPILLDRLRAGTIDVAILALPLRGHEFDTFPLLTERLFAVLPQKHKLASRPSLSLKDLRTEPFLLLRDGHCFRDTAVAACDRARLHPQIVFESGQFSSLLSMVGAGMGVSIVPEMAIEKKSQCRYVRIADEQAVRTIGAVVLRGRSLTRAQNAFLAHLRTPSPQPSS
ncbi:MAG: LysR family transcriptional regulator [Acidobacteria bacterium 13_2_20CM_57_17]|nr:MAG: LysR family transcriptional regulator [Acidobacteria bacterium 13_2_20CM_57_17]OLB96284.1 MAG: LysR family transcriptional regulator [Acidobacteria bacterium 13_2_20CM_2_57_12]OLE15803.1 MAG: LysR family transcriptional regulator [Acidobacteria bacterium 13_1_20CM_4_57_11]